MLLSFYLPSGGRCCPLSAIVFRNPTSFSNFVFSKPLNLAARLYMSLYRQLSASIMEGGRPNMVWVILYIRASPSPLGDARQDNITLSSEVHPPGWKTAMGPHRSQYVRDCARTTIMVNANTFVSWPWYSVNSSLSALPTSAWWVP